MSAFLMTFDQIDPMTRGLKVVNKFKQSETAKTA